MFLAGLLMVKRRWLFILNISELHLVFNLKNKRLNKVLYFQLVISIFFTHCIDLDPFYPLKCNKIS